MNEHLPTLEKAPVTSVVHNGEILPHRNSEKALSVAELLTLKNPSPEEIQFTVLSSVFPEVKREELDFSKFFTQRGEFFSLEKRTEARRFAVGIAALLLTQGKGIKAPITVSAIARCLGIAFTTAQFWVEEYQNIPHEFNIMDTVTDVKVQQYAEAIHELRAAGAPVSARTIAGRLNLPLQTVQSFLWRRRKEGVDVIGMFSEKKSPEGKTIYT